jgi:hypothetical protein
MIITPKQLQKIYGLSYSISESRGKGKQKQINQVITEMVSSKYLESDGFTIKTEVRLTKDVVGGKWFAIDVGVYKGEDLIHIFLAKAPASNIAQNAVNALNHKAGEVVRLHKLIQKGVKLTFVNFHVNTSPYFQRNGTIKVFETNPIHTLTDSDYRGGLAVQSFDEIVVSFDVSGLNDCKNKQEVKTLVCNEQVFTNINVRTYNE